MRLRPLTEDGVVKIVDFGLAKLAGRTVLTKSGTTLGTVAYMSPEQARGEPVDHRTDIWAFGVMLFEMLAGQLPFRGDYEQALIYSILNEEPEYGNGIPSGLKSILQKSLAKDVERRYQRTSDLLGDLKAIDGGKELESTTKISKRRQGNRVYLFAGAAILVMVVLAAIFWWSSAPGEQTIDSIAVLPLDNLSGDPAQEYFSDGMIEALITDLSKISALKVISRTSVMQYKGKRKPLPEIAKALGVKAVIEGSVMRDGDRVRITAQLIEAESDRHLWADSYERHLVNIFALQRDIAQAIARQVKVTLTPGEQQRLQDVQQIDPEAFEAYLKGIQHVSKYEPSDLLKSLEYSSQAVEIEPDFTLAYVGIVRACLGMMDVGGLPFSELYPKAKSALEKAQQLDNSLAEAFSVQGRVKLIAKWDWAGAEKAFRWLDIAYQEHYGGLFYIKADPSLETLHSDSRWVPFLRKMGLEP